MFFESVFGFDRQTGERQDYAYGFSFWAKNLWASKTRSNNFCEHKHMWKVEILLKYHNFRTVHVVKVSKLLLHSCHDFFSKKNVFQRKPRFGCFHGCEKCSYRCVFSTQWVWTFCSMSKRFLNLWQFLHDHCDSLDRSLSCTEWSVPKTCYRYNSLGRFQLKNQRSLWNWFQKVFVSSRLVGEMHHWKILVGETDWHALKVTRCSLRTSKWHKNASKPSKNSHF